MRRLIAVIALILPVEGAAQEGEDVFVFPDVQSLPPGSFVILDDQSKFERNDDGTISIDGIVNYGIFPNGLLVAPMKVVEKGSTVAIETVSQTIEDMVAWVCPMQIKPETITLSAGAFFAGASVTWNVNDLCVNYTP